MKIIIQIIFVLSLVVFSSCENDSTNDPVTNQDCLSNVDCPEGYYCEEFSGKCASEDDGNGALPDNNGLPTGDTGETTDDSGGGTSSGIKCDCFGTTYTIPYEFESISGWCKLDDDSDGIPNCIEVANEVKVDTDEDGESDYLDLDSDNDGISDARECPSLPCRDTDENGVPNYRDTDSDGDGIDDNIECFSDPCADYEEDGIPDYIDTDSDNDSVPDVYETAKDTDKDGMPNFLDFDSDDDGISDTDECATLPCPDSDGNGVPDFVDTDSDGDGLPDKQEVLCANLGIHSRTQADTDEDGFSDLAEVLTGSDPCDSANGVFDTGVKFYFELPYGEPEQTDILTFAPTVKKADIFFNVDTTGSMGGAISNLKSGLSYTIIPGVIARISDVAFGVGWFNDPAYGISNTPTTNTATAQSSVNGFAAGVPGSGGDLNEMGYDSLIQIANSGGWRDKTIPIVMHMTDAPSKGSRDNAVNALNSKGIKVMGILNGGSGGASLTDLANATGAVVPACAGAGRTTLMYDIGTNGNGLNDAVINGIDALVKYATFSLYVEAADDGDTGTIDTSCFLKRIEALEYVPVADGCAETIVATAAEFNGVGYNNGFNNFAPATSSATIPGSKLKFTVHAKNDTCFEPGSAAQMFKAIINVVDNSTGSFLDMQEVTIIVPGKVSGSDW